MCWGIFTALTAAVPSNLSFALVWFIAVRFLLGAAEAVMFPASNQFVSRWVSAPERGSANGLIFAGVGWVRASPRHSSRTSCFTMAGGLHFGCARRWD